MAGYTCYTLPSAKAQPTCLFYTSDRSRQGESTVISVLGSTKGKEDSKTERRERPCLIKVLCAKAAESTIPFTVFS